MSLPIFKSDDQSLMLMQSKWKSQLDPLLAKPMSDSVILKNVSLASGVNVVNHLLGRMMQGWRLTDIAGPATIYRSAPMSATILTLTSSATVVVSLEVF